MTAQPIEISPREDEMLSLALLSIRDRDDIYVYQNKLVRMVESKFSQANQEWNPPRAHAYAHSTLRTLLAKTCEWAAPSKKGPVICGPYGPTVQSLLDLGQWPGVREIDSIYDSPVFVGGSVVSKEGFHKQWGIYLSPNCSQPCVKAAPTLKDARESLSSLLSPLDQFYWDSETSKSVWLSLVLSLVARPSIEGPVPFHWFDASSKGSGKTKLVDLASIIATGSKSSTSGFDEDNLEEVRKSLEASAKKSTRLLNFDNVTGLIGGSEIERFVTSTRIAFRLLQTHEFSPPIPWRVVLAATTNNGGITGDMDRRTLRCRLVPKVEDPHNRKDLKIEDLDDYFLRCRPHFLEAVLTILKAYSVEGQPKQSWPLGSFESWSRNVRDCIIWLGMPDPVDSQLQFKNQEESALPHRLLLGLSEIPQARATGLTCSEILKEVVLHQNSFQDLRSLLLELGSRGELCSPKSLGRRLRGLCDKIIGGRKLIGEIDSHTKIIRWRVEQEGLPSTIQSTLAGFEPIELPAF